MMFLEKVFGAGLSPLFFVRGGFVNTNNQQLSSAGREGDYWSSRAYSSTTLAYHLAFVTSVDPSNSNVYRYYGYSLRCLIPTT